MVEISFPPLTCLMGELIFCVKPSEALLERSWVILALFMVHQAPRGVTREERFLSLIPHFTVEKTGYFCCLWLWKSPVIIPAAVASIIEPRALAYPRGPAPEAERDWISLRQVLAPGRSHLLCLSAWWVAEPWPSSAFSPLILILQLTVLDDSERTVLPPCSILSLQHLARPSHLPTDNVLHHLRSL